MNNTRVWSQLRLLFVWAAGRLYAGRAAHAYHRDHPDAELHLLRGGHWLLETDLDEMVGLIRSFLHRVP